MSQSALTLLKGYSDSDQMVSKVTLYVRLQRSIAVLRQPMFTFLNISCFFSLLFVFVILRGGWEVGCPIGIWQEKLRYENGSMLQSFVLSLQTKTQCWRERSPGFTSCRLFDMTHISSSHGGD